MKYGYLLIGLALVICVAGLFYVGADDSDAAGSGTLRDPYSSDPRLSSDEAKTIYVYTGTAFNIRFNATSTIVSVTSGHGLTSPVDTRLTGTLTGSNGDRVYVDMENHGSLFSHTIICVTPTHTATWNNWDGSCITSTSFNHGATPVYSGATPTRPADSQYVYEFTGWSPTPRASYDDVSYTAQYSSTVNTYTVTWVDWDGTVLETDSDVPYGTTPTYDGTTPVRPMDSQYMYEFAGWSPAVGPISGDTTYTAQIPAIWQYTLSSSDATIVAYLGSGGTGVDIEIPSSVTYNGTTYPVRTVGDGTNPVIPSTITGRNLVIPDSVYVIENHAFRRCTGLIGTLTLGSSITSIGDSAFADCSGLTGNLVIPNSVTSIDSGAFQNCSGFTGNLVIPDSITIIEHMVFAGCSGLNGTLTIGNSVTIIGKSAFVSTGFTGDLVIPNSVNSIGDTAFSGCRGFTGNLIISWDTTLGTDVFLYSGNLHFPYQFKNYDGTVLQSGYVLYNTAPSYIGSTPVRPSTTTENYYFDGWSPTLGAIITPVRYTAQYTTVNIFTVIWKDWNGTVLETDVGVEEGTTPTYDGATPTRPDQYQFTYSFSTWSPAVGPITGYTEYTAVYTETALWSYSIHEGYAGITGYLGLGGANVDIIIPSSVIDNNIIYPVEYVGTGEGYIFIPSTIQARNLIIPNSVFSISDEAFSGCSGLTGTLTIGSSVTMIGQSAFYNCSGFTGNLIIPNSVNTIYGGAFNGCSGFTGNLVIPDSVTEIIGGAAFMGCSGFEGTLSISNSLRTIPASTFEGCSGLSGNLIIPDSITTIDGDAFKGCSGLDGNLIISWDTSFSNDSFTGCTSLHFPYQFKNYDGTILQDRYTLYGQIPAYSGSTPTKPMDEDYEYAFAGWSPTPVAIQIPSRYTAEFTPLFRYTVTWTNWDDSVLLTDKWAEGTTPVYSGATPTRPATVQYTYEFSSWTPTPVAIYENTTFKADFTGTLITYDFGDWQYVLDDNYDAVISHITEREGVLQIPVVADGYAVKSFIGGNMVQATGIIIPRSITAVTNDAFSGSGITEVLNLSDVPITGTSYGLNNATVYTSVPGWMYINDTTYVERVPDDSPTSGLIRIIPLLIIIGIIVHILRNRVGNGDE